jgi:hypothetical protein
MKKFSGKIKKFVIALLIFALVLVGGVYLIAELTWFHGSLINPDGHGVTGDDHVNPTITPRPDTRVFEDEIPENIANRGIILLGTDYEPEYRTDNDSRYDPEGKRLWFNKYLCDCNLKIETTPEDLYEYCNGFSGFGEVFFKDYGSGEVGGINVPDTRLPDTHYWHIAVYRTCISNEDCSDGYFLYDGDPSYGLPVFFDPTGRFILEVHNSSLPDEVYLSFLEPRMISLDVRPAPCDELEPFHSENTQVIQLYVDAIHELRLTTSDADRTTLAMAENFTVFSFLDENGYKNDYTIVGEYLISGENVYHIENRDGLDALLALCDPENSKVITDASCGLSDRSVIFRGKANDDGVRVDPSTTDIPWYEAYRATEGVFKFSTAEEFLTFTEKFAEFGEGILSENSDRISFESEGHSFEICRTISVDTDSLTSDDNESVAFYDPSGKYILILDSVLGMDDIILRFYEPEPVSMTVSVDGEDAVEYSDSETIERYMDAMHELVVMGSARNIGSITDPENRLNITFTDINGNVTEYVFVDDYVRSGIKTYMMENSERIYSL